MSSVASLQYRLSYRLSQIVSRRSAYCIAACAAAAAHFIKKGERNAVRRNIATVIGGDPSGSAVKQAVKRLYSNFGRACVDTLYDMKADSSLRDRIQYKNLHYYEEAFHANRGVIAMTAHVGNWEVGGVALAALGRPLSVIANRHRDPFIEEVFFKRRHVFGMEVVSNRANAIRYLRVLRENGCLGILADRLYGAEGNEVSFFGRKVKLPQGATQMSMLSRSPILPIAAGMESDSGTYFLRLYKPLFPPDSKDERERDIFRQQAADALQEIILQEPEKWFAFEDVIDLSFKSHSYEEMR